MKHGSLFSGIGGFDLAAEWMGWENVFHCEWNEFGKRVLNYYWPNAISYDDITKTDFTIHRGSIDILTGGFPCQPYSTAGKRLGKEDERHLWPEMLRAIREIAPRFVVGENVRGLTNWNGGLVFDEVCADLENLGYQVAPFIIPASAVNAPHQRERIYFIAYSNYAGAGVNMRTDGVGTKVNQGWEGQPQPEHREDGNHGNASDSDSNGLERSIPAFIHRQVPSSQEHDAQRLSTRRGRVSFEDFPTQSPVCRRDDGVSPKLVGITVSKHRQESIKGYGNAVVPQVVYEIFKAIDKYSKVNL
jgi:DNA (cytosine-5)-methyltransferase 1